MDALTLAPATAAPFHHRYMRAISTVSRDSNSSTSGSSPDLTHDTTDDQGITPDTDEDGGTSPDTVVPKIEEQDDQHALASLTIDAKPIITDLQQLPQPSLPRKRGRPRKHPIVEQKKTTHARSKTGCGTCRKRKKKCDETKPSCMNCEKNNVVCDGYEPKQPWKPGKQKALTQRLPMPVELPLLVEGIECDTDRLFFRHFNEQVSKVLSLTDNGISPFLKIIFPMTFEHSGLMHSVLYLSGTTLLANAPNENREWQNRYAYHSEKALSRLREGIANTIQDDQTGGNGKSVESVKFSLDIAQTLILCLQTVCEGTTGGQFRFHLNAMKRMLYMQKGSLPSEDLRRFILEFLLYHDHSDAITNLKYKADTKALSLMEDFMLPSYMIQPQAGNLLGVLDGIFGYISRIRKLRDTIRDQRKLGRGNGLDDKDAAEAFAIDGALRAWQSSYPEGSARHTASLLYRLCTWIYLKRTILLSRPTLQLRAAVDDGLKLLGQLPWNKDNDSMQSILLMPVFLLGSAAFEPRQRPTIVETFDRLEGWSRLGNIKHARDVVEEIWRKMDQGLEQESWDWEQLIDNQGKDFLIT